MRLRRLAAATAAVAVLALAACAPPVPPEGSPDIRGSIETVSGASGSGGDTVEILVAGDKQADTGYERAAVSLTSATLVLVRTSGGWEPVDRGRLAPGDVVEVWFTGPVRESYPVGATGEAVAVYP